MKLEAFCDKVKKIYGDELRSVVLYGSAASGDHNKKFSDYNILIVLKTLGLDQLRKISGITNRWIRAGNPPPLMFTEEAITSSTDVFPVEFLDIKESHRVLWGEDHFKELNIDIKNLRLQCEHELRGKLIKLQESYILTEGKPKKAAELLVRSLSTFQVLFKSILRLLGRKAPAQKKDATRMLVEHLKLDGEVFEKIMEVREDFGQVKGFPVDQYMERYIGELHKIIEYVDSM